MKHNSRFDKQIAFFTLLFAGFIVLCISSCGSEVGSPTQPHTHEYELTTEGNLSCKCGQNITDPFIALLSGDSVEAYYLLTDSSAQILGVTVEGSQISYLNSVAKTVAIRTNASQSLVIDAPSDTVFHYGTAYKVKIISVASESFHEKGTINSSIEINQGHLHLEKPVPEVVVESNTALPVRVSLGSDITVEKVQVNKDSLGEIQFEGSQNSIIRTVETESPIKISVDIEMIEIKSEDVSLEASGDAHVYGVVVSESVNFTSENTLEIVISGDAVLDGLYGISSESLDIVQDVEKHVHTWGSGIVTKEATPDSEGEITYTCEGCSQQRVETVAKINAGAHGFVITEEPDRKIHSSISVIPVSGKESTVLVTFTSTNSNTDYSTTEYKWYVDYGSLAKVENEKKESSYEYYIPDGGIHIITCSYSNVYGGGSTSVQVSR